MSTLNIAIIGCGGITLQNHLPGLALCPGVKVIALYDANAATLERARRSIPSVVFCAERDHPNLVPNPDKWST